MKAMKKIRITAFFAALAIGIQGFAFAADDGFIYKNAFDSYISNVVPPEVKMLTNGEALVREDGKGNKALVITDNGATSEITVDTGELKGRYIVSAKFKSSDIMPNIEFGVYSSSENKKCPAVYVKEGAVSDASGKKIGTVGRGMYDEIALGFDTSAGVVSTAFNGMWKVSRQKVSSVPSKADRIYIKVTHKDRQNDIYVDDIKAYSGTKLDKTELKSSFNPTGYEYVKIDKSVPDRTVFDSGDIDDRMNIQSPWADSSFQPQGEKNIVKADMQDRFNPERKYGANGMYFEKSDEEPEGPIWNIYGTRLMQYKYVVAKADFMSTSFAPTTDLFYLVASYEGSRIDTPMVRFNSNGNIVTSSGNTVKTVKSGEWVNVIASIDCVEKKADIYINGEFADTVTLNKNLDNVGSLRIWIEYGAGKGNLNVKNCTVRCYSQKWTPAYEDNGTLFPNQDGFKEYLSDKIAFHQYAGNVVVNGEKYLPATMPQRIDDDLYVCIDAINHAFGLNIAEDGKSDTVTVEKDSAKVTSNGETVDMGLAVKEIDGKLMIPVKAFTENVIKKYTYDDGNGMILVADRKLNFDLSREIVEYMDSDNRNPTERPLSGLNRYIFFERPSAAEIQDILAKNTDNYTQHPRLLMKSTDFDRMREQRKTNEEFNSLVNKILVRADSYFEMDSFVYNIYDGQRLQDICRDMQGRVKNLSFAYQMTGDKKYAELAYKYMQEFTTFPDWNPSHIIDVPEAMVGLSVGFDWCYDAYTKEQRDVLADGMKRLGIDTLEKAYHGRMMSGGKADRGDIFVKWKSNFNTVVNGGAIMGALAFAEYYPEASAELIEHALRSLEYTMIGFLPAGGWIEGVGYWEYTMKFLLYGMKSLMTAAGTDFGMMKFQGLKETAMFIRSLDSFQGANNFHDAGTGRMVSMYMSWLGEIYNQPLYGLSRRVALQSGYECTVEDLMYYNSDADADENELPKDWWTEGVETISMRESYTNRTGMFASAHAGLVTCYHSQVDVGTFVYDVLGERWAMDLGMENYNLKLNNWGDTYRRRAEGQNVMLFNPDETTGQNPKGFAPKKEFVSKERGAYCIFDMSDIYPDYLSEAERGFLTQDDRRSLVIRDEFTMKDYTDGYWFMHTDAEAEVADNNTVILTKNRKKVKVSILTDIEGLETTVMDAVPLPTSPTVEGQNPNTGIRKIALKFNATGKHYIAVKLAPMGEAAANSEFTNVPMSEWTVPDGALAAAEDLSLKDILVNGKSNGGEITVPMTEGDPMPEITPVPNVSGKYCEVLPAENTDGETRIRIYNDARTTYMEHYINYKVYGIPKDVMDMHRYPILKVEVGSTPEPENNKWNMFDESMSTRWTTMTVGDTAVFDLGDEKKIDALAVAFWQGDKRVYKYELSVSNDGETWQKIASTPSEGAGYNLTETGGVTARYVRYTNLGNSVNVNGNILEFAILHKD